MGIPDSNPQGTALVNPARARRVRLVTHYGIDRADVREAAARIGQCLDAEQSAQSI
jgi:hypothetical protein